MSELLSAISTQRTAFFYVSSVNLMFWEAGKVKWKISKLITKSTMKASKEVKQTASERQYGLKEEGQMHFFFQFIQQIRTLLEVV